MALIKNKTGYKDGFNPVILQKDYPKAEMDFEILVMNKGEKRRLQYRKELALLLIKGAATLSWEDQSEEISRQSCFQDNPVCLGLPKGVVAEILCREDKTEFAVMTTENDKTFESKFYSKEACASEERGAGILNECATRIVRSIINREVCEGSNFVMGEVINYPGKWSSFPPHSHPQPEIYYYRFLPSVAGFGFSQDTGDVAHVVRENDALLAVEGNIHAQVAAPGYAMFYIWVIRNSDDRPYFLPPPIEEHAWMLKPDVKIFPNID